MVSVRIFELVKDLVSWDRGRRALVTILPLTLSLGAYAQLSDPTSLGFFPSGGGNPTNLFIDAVLTNQTATLKMTGGFGPVLGSDWTLISNGNESFDFHSQARALGGISAGTSVRLDWDFTIQATGGTVSWSLLNGASGDDTNGDSQYYSNSYAGGGSLGHQHGSLSTPVTSGIVARGGVFGDLYISWTGYSDNDTLTVTIPDHSIDTTLVPVREIDPSSYNQTHGTYVSSQLSDVFSVDNSYLVFQSFPAPTPLLPELTVVFTGTSPFSNPSDIRFLLDCHVNTVNVGETIELFDYQANTWVRVASGASTQSDSLLVGVGANPARFVQSVTNQTKARVSYKSTGPTFGIVWRAFLNQAVWNVSP